MLGDPGYLDRLYAGFKDGWITAAEFNRTERAHAFVRDGAGEPPRRRVVAAECREHGPTTVTHESHGLVYRACGCHSVLADNPRQVS